MKPVAVLLALSALTACAPPQSLPRIYRFPEAATPAPGFGIAMRFQGGATIVDHRNHDLPEPDRGQRWVLVPGAFLLTQADGTILSAVAAAYQGDIGL